VNARALLRGLAIVGAVAGVAVAGELVGKLSTSTPSNGFWPAPYPVLILALAPGCMTALTAIGLVLIYRATRIINFAHAGFAAATSTLFYELLMFKHWPYGLALAAALGAGLVGGAVVELFFIRRFARAPRLVLTVVTLAIAQMLIGIAGQIPKWLDDKRPRADPPVTPLGRHKWILSGHIGVINGDHVLLFAFTALVLAGFVLFFRFTSLGVAIRGAAENDDRASSLGVNTRVLSSFVWTVAAGLATAAALMQTSLNGRQLIGTSVAVGGVGSALLLRSLAAAVIGGMENLPVTVAAAFALSLFDASLAFSFSRSEMVDGVLLIVLVSVLLLKRKQLSRAQDSGFGTWAATEEIRPTPDVLAALPSVKTGLRRVQVVIAVVLLAGPWLMSPGQLSQISLFAIYGIVVLSLVVLTGWGGQISLGQFGFVAMGGLIGGGLMHSAHWPFLPALLAGSLAGAATAVLVGLPALRIRGLFLAVTTLSFAVAISSIGLNPHYVGFIPPSLNRPKLVWIGLEDERAMFYFCLGALLLTLAAVVSMRRSRTGRVLIAMRENERTAQSYGVNLVRTRLATFALSGFLAGLAGVLLVVHQHRLASTTFGPEQSIQIFLMAVIGGLGSPVGALTGAVVLGLLNLWLGPDARLLASGAGLLTLLLFFPGGFGAMVFSVRDAVLRRVAIRRRIHVPSLLGETGFAGATAAKTQLAPRFDADGKQEEKSRWEYALESRLEHAGASQQERRWGFS
jgi:branched-chain amino acid transport system permease protein